MKTKFFKLLALICIITLLTGCSENNATSSKTNSEQDNDAATPTVIINESTTEDSSEAAEEGAVDTEDKETEIADTEIYVFIAASLNNAMTELAAKYNETQPNVKITYNADSSGTLKTQIEEGAECDMFFSAATKQLTTLSDEGYVDNTSIINLLENKVVLIKPVGVETAVTGFENIYEAESLALAAESVPVGDYARQIFNNLGIWEKVQTMEINEGSNVTAVLTAIIEASNEVGIVYETDAETVKNSVEIIAEAPEGSLNNPVVYPVGLVSNPEADATQKEAAKSFLEFLSSDTALSIFESYGFTIAN